MENKILLERIIPTDREVLFACIGTDRSTGDSLGPLVGTELSKRGYTVIGTVHHPLHALNLEEAIENIKQNYPNHLVVAVDACLGNVENIGQVIVQPGPLYPGKAVKKELPPMGDIAIKGIVNIGGFMEYSVLQNTRLSVVLDIANEIITTCDEVMQKRISHKKKSFNLVAFANQYLFKKLKRRVKFI